MDRSCPKRKKTKKILCDAEVKKYLSSQENEDSEKQKMIQLTKVPEDWETGLCLNLYHDGYTFNVHPDSKLASDMISYDECDFLRNIEAGLIPDVLMPVLNDMEMLSENKLVVSISDYRGFPRPGATQPYILDYPIIKRHVLSRSLQSLVLELYDTVGEQLTLQQIQTLENYLTMLNTPPLCLDTSPQVFELKCGIHHNQNMLNESTIRKLISKSLKSENFSTVPDALAELCETIQHSKDSADISSSKEKMVDGMLKKSRIPAEYTAPNVLNDILDLCVKRARSARILNEQSAMRHMNAPRSAENHQIQGPDQLPPHSEVSPSGYSTPAPPQLKPAPFISSNKAPGVMAPRDVTMATRDVTMTARDVMTPISPNIPQQIVAQTSPLTPQTGMAPAGPASATMSPKSVAAVSRMPGDAMGKVRGAYSPGYMVPQQQLNKGQLQTQQVSGVRVPMMTINQQQGMIPSQQGLIRAPGAAIMGNMHLPQHIPPQTPQGHIVQKPMNADGMPQMNKPMQNTGMMMPQYQRNYYNVQSMPRGFVEQAQYIPVQQARPGQVLQISLPPNMNPHQSRPRQQGLGGMPPQPPPQQQPIHRVPYNQMQMGGMQNPNMYNQYG